MQIFDVQKLIFEVSEGPGGVQGRLWRAFGVPIGFFGFLMRKCQKFVGFWRQVGAQVGAKKYIFGIKTWKIPFPKACWKNIDFYTILKPKSRLFRRRRTSKNSDFACEGCHFFENSLIEVGSRKKRARRRSGEAILGSKMGSKWEKWGPKGRSKSELFLRFKKVMQEHAGNFDRLGGPSPEITILMTSFQ